MSHESRSSRPIRFLLLEDSTVASIDLECILEDLGHSVTAVAASRRRAREEISRHCGAIDAAIVDENLVGRSTRALIETLTRHGIPCAVANSDKKPFTAAGVAGLLEQLKAG